MWKPTAGTVRPGSMVPVEVMPKLVQQAPNLAQQPTLFPTPGRPPRCHAFTGDCHLPEARPTLQLHQNWLRSRPNTCALSQSNRISTRLRKDTCTQHSTQEGNSNVSWSVRAVAPHLVPCHSCVQPGWLPVPLLMTLSGDRCQATGVNDILYEIRL